MNNNIKGSMTITEYIKAKALDLLGLITNKINPNSKAEDRMFVNDISEIRKLRLKEYNIWYDGDSDELLNFYTRAMNIDYNHDPIYNRNKKSYFWCVSSTESDIKRTHTGIPRDIIDTLVNIVAIPNISAKNETDSKKLSKILSDNNFNHLLVQEARPLTLVEGWGAYKIDWDKTLQDTPIIRYYRAENVDFFYKSNTLCAICYKDYYTDIDKHNYILFEIRRLGKEKSKKTGQLESGLIIEKELFELSQGGMLTKKELTDLPQLRDVEKKIFFRNYKHLLGVPNIYFEDSKDEMYGRSIFTGKIDYFDDADQCASQAANAVRRSTPTEVFDTQYLERDDKTGMPIMPKAFDRKYVMIRGMKDADGGAGKNKPVEVIQPQIDFMTYSAESKEIFVNILQGVMSPASFGIDVSIKDNAASQREKEKITIYTRNSTIAEEKRALKQLFSDALYAQSIMDKGKTNGIDDLMEHEIDITYNEFADTSFEHKMDVVGNAYQGGIISPDMAVELLYPDDKDKRARELSYLTEQKEQEAQAQQMMAGGMGPQMPPMTPEELAQIGEEQGGMNNNPVDQARMQSENVDESVETPETNNLDTTRK